jgi:DNA-binding response OmpR family regulator
MSIPTVAAPEATARRLILLVDDDVFILVLLGKFLEAAGYEVRIATSAEMALEMLLESGREPDLALLDVAMPGMSGLELARRLQEETTVPVMFLSADEDGDTVSQAAEYGAIGYLVKPIDMAQLGPSIRASLARADEIRALRSSQTKLTQALQNGRETGMAVGVLMERCKVDREQAFRLLRDHARSQQRKLNDVAADLLSAAEALNAFTARLAMPGARK